MRDLRSRQSWFVVVDAVVVHGCGGYILVVVAAGVADIDVVLERDVVSSGRLVVSRRVC